MHKLMVVELGNGLANGFDDGASNREFEATGTFDKFMEVPPVQKLEHEVRHPGRHVGVIHLIQPWMDERCCNAGALNE
jgi:hypothetical protein